jgi:hypothetical protein
MEQVRPMKIMFGARIFHALMRNGQWDRGAASTWFARRDVAGDDLVDLVLHGLGGHADGAGHGAFARGGVGLEHHAVEAEQRRAAVNFRVHAAADGLKRALGQIRADLALVLCISSRLSMENIATARLSTVFKTMLPTKPSHTTTST